MNNVNAMILIAARGFRVYALVIIDLCFSVWLIISITECSHASPGSPCTNLEADDCKYEHIGEHCCCGQCADSHWLSLACVLDSTTGAGLWQPIDLMLCPAEGCGSEGEW